jgi:hypothetical protein
MFDPNDITEKDDGSCDIFCETMEKQEHIYALLEQHLQVQGDEDAIFSLTPPSKRRRGEPIEEKPVVSIINVKAPKADIMFALDAGEKMIRPYPKPKT